MRKVINPSRFSWNPETKEKIHTHYYVYEGKEIIKQEEIKLNDGQKKKLVEATIACQKQASKEVENTAKAYRKPKYKHLGKDKPDPVKEEVKVEVKEEIKPKK